MTISELQLKISEIMAVIRQLQALLAGLKPGMSGIPGGYAFQTNLKYGTSNTDVKYLQTVLNQNSETRVSDTGPGSLSSETSYFGQKTLSAVIKFQAKYSIPATGYVGPITRAKLNELLGQPSIPSTPITPTTPLSPSQTYCGDGITQRPNYRGQIEECDSNDLLSQTCITKGYTGGTLSCTTKCTFDSSRCTSGTPTPTTPTPTTPTPTPTIICGNNTKETGETCDGTDLGEFGNGVNKCVSYSSSYQSGNLSCSSDCKTLITSNCQLKPAIPTLSVDLKVSTNSSSWQDSLTGIAPLTGVDLRATISGTATGTINYSFDCQNDGTWDSPDNTQYKGITQTTKEFTDGCSYQTSGTYTARVKVERNIAPPAYDTVIITVSQLTAYNASVSNASGNPGATSIAVPINLNNIGTREIIGIDIQLTYNSSLITAVEVQKGSLTQGWNLTANTSVAGEVKIALYNSAKLLSGGEMAKVIFNVKSTAIAGSSSALTITKFDANETAVPSITNGTFTIQTAPLSKLDENKLNNLASVLSAIQEILKKIQNIF